MSPRCILRQILSMGQNSPVRSWHNSYPDRFGCNLKVRLGDEVEFDSIEKRFGNQRPFATSNPCCVAAGEGCHRIALVSGENGNFGENPLCFVGALCKTKHLFTTHRTSDC